MPSFEWNKVIASILTALIVAMVSGILAGKLVAPTELKKPVFEVASTEQAAPAAKSAAAPPPIGALLAQADPKKGEQDAAVCKACHTFSKGGANKIGPNLWDVGESGMGEDRAGYAFSAGMAKKKGTKWTPELLDKWLTNPQAFIPGTKMTFAGIPEAKKRADVVAYLETLTPGGLSAEKALAAKLAAQTPKPTAAKQSPPPAKAASAAIAPLLAKADPKKGEQMTAVCRACHSFDKGGKSMIGPNLYGVVGGPIAKDRGGYPFSPALVKLKGRKWDPETLSKWLDDPQAFAPGTKMTFAGIKKAQERADVIAYLQTLK